MNWILAIVVVGAVFLLGVRIAHRSGREGAIATLIQVDRTGRAAQAHQIATEAVLERFEGTRRDLAEQAITAYRLELPRAILKAAWAEKVSQPPEGT